MMNKIKKYLICNLVIYLCIICTNCILGATSTAKIGSNEYTWYNLPEGLKAQEPPSEEHVEYTKNMKSTVYGLFGDVAVGSCTGGVGTKDGYQYCKDQLGTSYMITPTFDEAVDKEIIPRIVATAYSQNGNVFEIPRGTLIYVKSNVTGVSDYGYALVADTGGGVAVGALDLYMPYAANNTHKSDAEKFNYGLDYRELLNLYQNGSITVYVTKYTLPRDQYIYMVPKGTIVEDTTSGPSSEVTEKENSINKKIIYSNTKTITRVGTIPPTLTTNCKDATAAFWSKTTTIKYHEPNVGSSGNGTSSNVTGKKVFISCSNQNWNPYAAGSTNEHEQMYKLGQALKKVLDGKGYTTNVYYDPAFTNVISQNITEGTNWLGDLNSGLYIALHSNAGGGSGPITFYYEGNDDSKQFAQYINDNLYELYKSKGGTASPYGIRSAQGFSPQIAEVTGSGHKVVSILTEVAFHDNAEEAQYIIDNIDNIANAIASGIDKYYVENPSKSYTGMEKSEFTSRTMPGTYSGKQQEIQKMTDLEALARVIYRRTRR